MSTPEQEVALPSEQAKYGSTEERLRQVINVCDKLHGLYLSMKESVWRLEKKVREYDEGEKAPKRSAITLLSEDLRERLENLERLIRNQEESLRGVYAFQRSLTRMEVQLNWLEEKVLGNE